jgi:hypothetical protein
LQALLVRAALLGMDGPLKHKYTFLQLSH